MSAEVLGELWQGNTHHMPDWANDCATSCTTVSVKLLSDYGFCLGANFATICTTSELQQDMGPKIKSHFKHNGKRRNI